MTAKSNLGSTTIQAEATYMGAGSGAVRVIETQEVVDTTSLVRESLPDTSTRASIWNGGTAPTLGLRSGEPDVIVDLAGMGANAGGIIADDSSGAVISLAVGVSSGGTGTTAIAGWTTTTGATAIGGAAGLAKAEMILVETTTGNWVAAIADIVTDTLTVVPALPTAPAAAAKLYAGVTYTPTETRLTCILKIHKDSEPVGYEARGVHFTPEFSNLGAGEGKARLTLKSTIGDWDHITSALATADPPDTFVGPGVIQDHGRFVLTDGTATVTCIASTFTVSALLTAMRRQDACAENVVGAPEILPSADRQIETELWQSAGASTGPLAQLRIWFAAGTMLSCLYQIGNTPGDVLAFYFPGVYLKDEPKEMDKNGLMAIKTTLKISIDANSTVFTKPFYFARF